MYLTQIWTFSPWSWILKLHKHQDPESFLNLTHCRDNLKCHVVIKLADITGVSLSLLFWYKQSSTFGHLTFIHYKFSHLIHLLYAEFGLVYTSDKQPFKLLHSATVKLSSELYVVSTKCQKGWSQWLRRLRCGSVATRFLRLWVQIPMGAWMFAYCECCVLSGTGLCDRPITCPEETCRVWCV